MRNLSLPGVFTTLTVILAAGPAAAQPPRKDPPVKPSPLDGIKGYKRHVIEGFTLMVSEDVAAADVSAFERKPLDVLELELKTITGMMTPKVADLLRRLIIWVEWDEKFQMNNGRAGEAVAVYYGGHQQSLLAEGKQPLKAKTVTVLRMKSLTAEHQPKTDRGRCVLLHEISHAVHDQLLGEDNTAVAAAFKQGMERKLYDKGTYAATNEHEFFAELTCAYFDQLSYFPHSRAELKKHDPVTFKMLESLWGAASRKPDPKASAGGPAGLAATTGADKFDFEVRVSDLTVGEAIHGPTVAAADLRKGVVLVGFWGRTEAVMLDKLAAVHAELAPYGLTVVVGPGYVVPTDKAKAELAARGVAFTAVDDLWIRSKADRTLHVEKPPHCLLFDATGACVFRGSGYEAAPHARAAVGRHLLATLNRTEYPKPLAAAVDELTGGQPLLAAAPKLTAALTSTDPGVVNDARALLTALTAPGLDALAKAQQLAKPDPVAAYLLAEPLPAAYKGTAVEAKAAALVRTLAATAAVQTEVRARVYLEQVKKVDAALSGQAGSFNPTDPAFKAKNAALFQQLAASLAQLKKSFPAAKATEQAGRIAKGYGVE